jgi:hypothetical protein
LEDVDVGDDASQYLIRDPAVRARVAAKNESGILDFLRDELYSTTAILGDVIAVQPRQARNVLARLERKGFVVRDEVRFMGRKAIPLWGITFQGLMEGLTPEKIASASLRPHKVGSVKVPMLEHTLAIQACRAWHLGEPNFIQWDMERNLPCRHLPTRDLSRWLHYPDAVLTTGSAQNPSRIAVEVELNHKSQPRYAQIIRAHYNNIENNRYQKIWYFCRTHTHADKLAALFLRIAKDQKIAYWEHGERLTVERSLELFTFFSLQDLD